MKKVEKQKPPVFFLDYIKRHKPKHWNDIASIRIDLRKHLWHEQGQCCAYTGVRIPCSDYNCHIDHFRTRNLFPELMFEYENLLASCNSEVYGAKHKDKLIKSKEDYKELINPTEESPCEHLEYTFTGKVIARNNSTKGAKTISYFNLNERSLLERRKTILSFLPLMKDLTVDEIVESTGEFETMIRQLHDSL